MVPCSRARDSNPFLGESSHTFQTKAASSQEVILTPLELGTLADILSLNKAQLNERIRHA
jgi:hypothetical protein